MNERIGWLAAALLACACACGDDAIATCRSSASAIAICGVQNPEDLAPLPDGRAILVSEFGSMDQDKPGAIAWLDVASNEVTPLFPQGGPGAAPVVHEGPDWGDAHCPGPPDQQFNPHGIDLQRRDDGTLALLVVNHGGREAVELFEVNLASRELHWRGCVPMPEGTFQNDVAALPHEGFAVTHMFDKSYGARALYHLGRAALGFDTGHVLLWWPGKPVKKLAGSEGPFPNGVEASEDGRELLVNMYMANEVRRIELATGKLLGRARVTHPDNLTWSDDGTLLIASHVAGLFAMAACGRIERGACGAAFEIVSLDPKTMSARTLLARSGPPMGAATVAIALGDELLLGSFKSDRLLRVPRPAR